MLKQAQDDRFKPNYRFYVIFCRKIEKMNFYFVPGIILDHFSYPKSIFGYRKVNFLLNFAKINFDQKIDFL